MAGKLCRASPNPAPLGDSGADIHFDATTIAEAAA